MKVRKVIRGQIVGSVVRQVNNHRQQKVIAGTMMLADRRSRAMAQLDTMSEAVRRIRETNRGGQKGQHGFYGELAQVHISNARDIMEGKEPSYVWVNDNGPVDYYRGTTPIQQKAVNSDGAFGLRHVAQHNQDNPGFVSKDGGRYQIPRDFSRDYERYRNMRPEDAGKLHKYDWRHWKRVQEFRERNPDCVVEPMVVDYKDIQRDAIDDTISRERTSIDHRHDDLKSAVINANKPTFAECNKIACGSAAMEGVIDGLTAVLEHKQNGKKLTEFEASDWNDIGACTIKGAAKGYVRGAGIYTLTNISRLSAPAASAVVSVAFTTVEAVDKCQRGEMTGTECATQIAEGTLDAAVCASFAKLGQKLIPNPIVGSLVGGTVGMVVCRFAKGKIKRYIEEMSIVQEAVA